MSDFLEAIEDEIEELFPPKPGGLVDQHRQAREAEEQAAEGLAAAESHIPEPSMYTVQVTEQMPEIVGAKTVNLGSKASLMILPYDPMRRRAVISVITPGGQAGVAGSQPGADAAANGDPTVSYQLYGPPVTPATGVSSESAGSAAAPAGSTTITSVAGLPSGIYIVSWTVELAGTTGAGDSNNFVLKNGAASLLASSNPGAVGSYPQEEVQVQVTGGTISIASSGAGTAGSTYSAQLIVTPVTLATPSSAFAPLVLESRGQLFAGNPGSSLVQISVITEVRAPD